jgi:hypothetical protein
MLDIIQLGQCKLNSILFVQDDGWENVKLKNVSFIIILLNKVLVEHHRKVDLKVYPMYLKVLSD